MRFSPVVRATVRAAFSAFPRLSPRAFPCAPRTPDRRHALAAGLAAALTLSVAAPRPALAQAGYPDRPIRVIFGFAAGGGTDAVVRAISASLSANLGVPLIVENKPGANANIAGEQVARAPADGYTLLYNTSSIALSPSLYAHLSYDVTKDLAPIALTANIPLVMVASPQTPVANIKEFVAYLKAHPGKVDYASSGTGNITHLAAAQFVNTVHAQSVHIPYKSEAPVLTDLIGGQVQFYFGNANALIPLVKANKVKGLAVTSGKRLASLPDLPTLSESVAPGMELGAWSGFMAPAGTPPAVIAKLSAALKKSMTDPALIAKIEATGAEVRYTTPDEYRVFMQGEIKRWGEAVRAAGLKPE
jgi:tripartite-type tricarboxylate transporter receptor subunit TctC